MSFWDRVKKTDGCWIWAGAVDTGGYGHLRHGDRIRRAHRVAYELSCGSISDDSHVLHACDNRLCCNPAHLRLGTHADNMADMKARGRRKNVCRGESNGRAVLTIADVKKIRLDPRGTRTIAKEYPVSRAAIQRIKSGKAWAA